ncbi:MAG: PilZ domain-containing protein [Candidatus Methylomirabilales bacterium]
MSDHPKSLVRRHLRFSRYLPVRCATLISKHPYLRPLGGKTQSIGAGGLAILLRESLALGTPLLVQVSGEDPVHGNVVWVGQGNPSILGTIFPHGVAFERPVDAALVRQWMSQSKQRVQGRAPVRFDVEYTQAQAIARGTCLSLSRGGMFITTKRPAVPGPEVMLHFTLPGLPKRLSILAQVVWVCREETSPTAITGMGVRFLKPEASEAAMIGTVVDRIRAEAPTSPNSFQHPPSPPR